LSPEGGKIHTLWFFLFPAISSKKQCVISSDLSWKDGNFGGNHLEKIPRNVADRVYMH